MQKIAENQPLNMAAEYLYAKQGAVTCCGTSPDPVIRPLAGGILAELKCSRCGDSAGCSRATEAMALNDAVGVWNEFRKKEGHRRQTGSHGGNAWPNSSGTSQYYVTTV